MTPLFEQSNTEQIELIKQDLVLPNLLLDENRRNRHYQKKQTKKNKKTKQK